MGRVGFGDQGINVCGSDRTSVPLQHKNQPSIMCMFNEPVVDVSGTQILVAPTTTEGQQLTVYANEVTTSDPNAMILPVPVTANQPDEDNHGIEFIDLSEYVEVFDNLAELVAFTGEDSDDDDDEGFDSSSSSRAFLEVKQVGSFKVSVVPTLDDFDRLNQDVFALSSTLSEVLAIHYPKGFAFVVAKFEQGGKFHPLAYTHAMLDGKLFTPCRHEHGNGDEKRAFYDHSIYTIHTNNRDHVKDIQATETVAMEETDVDLVRWDELTGIVKPVSGKFIKKYEVSGKQANDDILFDVDQDAVAMSISSKE
eukprot:TRINITY_DN5160_c0_g2_i2.p1 TRINITY_DN5160_c0_g2~~TRINITY_DN5160_c0_g2_i2.p1  ORF type:complete len:309 (-),score=97.39 TRINITY_DN5160_c0_g2_i2:198-1124(-)